MLHTPPSPPPPPGVAPVTPAAPARAGAASLVADPAAFAVRASSTLRGAARQFGPALMFDGRSDTCWNSDAAGGAGGGGGGGGGQWLELAFRRPVDVQAVCLTFQGGFVGQGGSVAVRGGGGAGGGSGGSAATSGPGGGGGGGSGAPWRTVHRFEPDDSNAPQAFALLPGAACGVSSLRLAFERSTDFYGRVTVYALDVRGWPGAAVQA